MAPVVQGKVLRLLQNQRIERVGGNETITTNIRVITSTNRPLEEMVEEKTFRADLLYRLNGMTISLPPLRHRREDIPLLITHFLGRAQQSLNKQNIEGISRECLEILMNYDWPGNVRQMQSVVQQSVLNSSGPIIIPEFLPHEVTESPVSEAEFSPVNATHLLSNMPQEMTNHDSPAIVDLETFIECQLKLNPTDLYDAVVERMERY